MNLQKIAITAFSSISPLGNNAEEVWKNYLNNQHCFTKQFLDQQDTSVAALSADSEQLVTAVRESDSKYKFLDDSVL
ncbi:beta-ketoacyl synthase, partial [Flavobacterium circumlabens]